MTKRTTKRTQINQHYHPVKYGKMKKPGTKGAPTKKQFKRAAKTAKRRKK